MVVAKFLTRLLVSYNETTPFIIKNPGGFVFHCNVSFGQNVFPKLRFKQREK